MNSLWIICTVEWKLVEWFLLRIVRIKEMKILTKMVYVKIKCNYEVTISFATEILEFDIIS